MNPTYIRRWRKCRIALKKIIRNRDDGFTLLEVLAAIALLSIVVTPLLGLITSSLAMHSQREYQTRAAFLAQLRLEEVKQKITGSSDFGGADYNKPGVSTTDFRTEDGFHESDSKFRYTIWHDGDADMKHVKVIAWCDKNGDNAISESEQVVELNTKVARRM